MSRLRIALIFSLTASLAQADLVLLAPQLNLKPRELCSMELKLIQALRFNLFVPTSLEFSQAFLSLVVDAVGDESLLLDPLQQWTQKYLKYLDGDLANIEFIQSEKALGAITCAVARWSLMHLPLASSADEGTAMEKLICELSNGEPGPEAIVDVPGRDPAVTSVFKALRSVIKHADLFSVDPVRRRNIEKRIVSAISRDTETEYPVAPAPRVAAAASEAEEPASDAFRPIAVRPAAVVAPAAAPSLSSAEASAAPPAGDDSTAFTAVPKRKPDSDSRPVKVAEEAPVVKPTPLKADSKFKTLFDGEGSLSTSSPVDVADVDAADAPMKECSGAKTSPGPLKRRSSARLESNKRSKA